MTDEAKKSARLSRPRSNADGLKSSTQFLEENGMEDTLKLIRKLEHAWAERGLKTRRCWKRILLGTSKGQGCVLSLANGKKVELPSLRGNKKFVQEVWGGEDKIPDDLKAGEDGKPKTRKRKTETKPAEGEAPKRRRGRPPKEKKEPEPAETPKEEVKQEPDNGDEPAPAEPVAEEKEEQAAPETDEKREAVKRKIAEAVTKSKEKGGTSLAAVLSSEWRTEASIAEAMGKSLRLVQKDLEALERRGFAVARKTKRKDDDGKSVVEWRKV